VKLAVVVVALAACQVRPSDQDVFYDFDLDGRPVVLDGGMTGSDAPHEGSGSGDGGGSGSGDGGVGNGDAGTGGDAGDGTGGPGGGPGLGNHETVDDTSFYACSAGGLGGALVPTIAIVIGVVRRRRRV
jgi:hypothetical protein